MRRLPALAAALALSAATAAHGVIVLGPQGRNLSAPTGDLATAGWQYQGQWAGFLGTPVGPSSFLTARHVGGSKGGTFAYGGQTYTATASTDVPNTDLRLWTVAGTFPTYAPVWDAAVDGPEVGRPVFVVGRGTKRGSPLALPTNLDPNAVAGPLPGAGPVAPTPVARAAPPLDPAATPAVGPSELRGWAHGGEDRLQSWGTNVVDFIADGGDRLGPLLALSFDADGGENEAALSGGDSGGGVFLLAPDGAWKLAGINYGIDGPFSLTADGPTFGAAVFDARGLWYDFDGPGPDPRALIEADGPVPAGGYATPVSAHLNAIRPFVGPASVPEPACGTIRRSGTPERTKPYGVAGRVVGSVVAGPLAASVGGATRSAGTSAPGGRTIGTPSSPTSCSVPSKRGRG